MAAAARARPALGFLAWLSLCIVTSAVGALASVNAPASYAALARPGWAPPGWVFGPVWSVLFLAVAVAVWQVWRLPGASRARTLALRLFVVQLVASALWSWLFFGWRLGGLAFAEVLVLWLLIAGTLAAFWRVKPRAAVLLQPYLAWVSFAAALNLPFWRMNTALLGLAILEAPTCLS